MEAKLALRRISPRTAQEITVKVSRSANYLHVTNRPTTVSHPHTMCG